MFSLSNSRITGAADHRLLAWVLAKGPETKPGTVQEPSKEFSAGSLPLLTCRVCATN